MILLLLALVQDKEWFPVEKGTSWTYVVDGKETTTVSRGAAKVPPQRCVTCAPAEAGNSRRRCCSRRACTGGRCAC